VTASVFLAGKQSVHDPKTREELKDKIARLLQVSWSSCSDSTRPCPAVTPGRFPLNCGPDNSNKSHHSLPGLLLLPAVSYSSW